MIIIIIMVVYTFKNLASDSFLVIFGGDGKSSDIWLIIVLHRDRPLTTSVSLQNNVAKVAAKVCKFHKILHCQSMTDVPLRARSRSSASRGPCKIAKSSWPAWLATPRPHCPLHPLSRDWFESAKGRNTVLN